MERFFDRYELEIIKSEPSCFLNSEGVYQDGTTPMYRDAEGTLWAMSGHSHMGHIAMFSGKSLDDLSQRWPIETQFCVGNAEHAFSGIRYPEGILPRGSIWPFVLYICPNTNRFFCWFHNETGWNGKGTAYDAFGPCDNPRFDSDFRHVGLMHSDDQGKTWYFDRWVLTGNEVCFTDRYNPGAGNALGQKGDIVRFGSGDFCMYVEPEGDYIYLFYNIITMDLSKDNGDEVWQACDAYVARCRKRSDGSMGDFVKYYDQSFCEAGNLGRESCILRDAWHPRVVYYPKDDIYFMTSKPMMKAKKGFIHGLDKKRKVMQVSTSKDMIHWSEPQVVYDKEGMPWGNHYNAMAPDSENSIPNVLDSDEFSILNNHNGTDVIRHRVKLIKK